jgi:lipoprotein-releasing system permease protein
MRFETFIARRYLRARRKQVMISFITFISVVGIMMGVAALIVILSLYAGMSQDLQQKILGATAHLTLTPRNSPEFRHYRDTMDRLSKVKGVVHVSPAIYVQALVSSGSTAAGAVLKGVDPVREKQVIDRFTILKKGSFSALTEGRCVVLGREMARRLGVGVGNHVTVIVPRGTLSPIGLVPRIHRYRVVGIFETGLYDLDNTWGYVSMAEGRRLAGVPDDAVEALELRVRDIYDVERVQREVMDILGPDVNATNWIEMNKPLFSALQLEKWGMFLAIGLIVLVASLNIVTTLVLMVMEKSRDIAILRAMGASARQVMRIFVWQGLLIGSVGTLLGVALGVGLSWACDRYRWIHLDPQVYSIAYLPFQIRPLDVLLVAAAALTISFLATLHPSRQAARIDPVEAIRYE